MPANPLGVALRNRRAGHHTLIWARPDLQAPGGAAGPGPCRYGRTGLTPTSSSSSPSTWPRACPPASPSMT